MVTYAERPWVKNYDSFVPPSLAPYPNEPLHNSLIRAAETAPNAVALVTSAHLPVAGRVGREMTYAELHRQSDALAAALQAMGVKRGDRVAIVMPNIAGFVISFYAILKAGGVVAAMNPTFPAEKLQWYLDDCDAKIAIVMSLFYETVRSVQKQTKIEKIIVTNIKEFLPPLAATLFSIAKEKKGGHRVASLAPNDVWFQDVLKQHEGKKPTGTVTGDDVAIFQYTGGTTGISKAAMATHRALVANTIQGKAWLMGNQDNENEVFLAAIPMFHVFGMIAVLSFAVVMKAKMVLVPNPRDLDDVLDVIAKYQPTLFNGVPALYNAINEHPDVKSGKRTLRSINLCISGSAPLPPSVKRRFEELCNGTLLEAYGMSEAPTGTHCNPTAGENRTGSIGLPMPDMDMRIVSLEDGISEVPVGEIGELLMAGPQVMCGYHNKLEETKITLREIDGKTWLYTGDIARMDEDGYFYIIDRKKDMALIGGFNVYPTNIEKILADHPAVLEVAVAAIPHPTNPGQEALKAWVVRRAGQTVTEEELISHASKRLAPYEVPRRFAFIEALPKTAVGKTLRRELVAMDAQSPN
jgi:long-chain acyl-CoA synthetase